MEILNKLIFIVTRQKFLLSLEFGCDPTIVFPNGDSYKFEGVRIDSDDMTINPNSFKVLTCRSGIPKSQDEVFPMVCNGLKERGMMVTESEPYTN